MSAATREQLQAFLVERGLSQRAFARAMARRLYGIDLPTQAQVEQCRRALGRWLSPTHPATPSPRNARLLGELLGADPTLFQDQPMPSLERRVEALENALVQAVGALEASLLALADGISELRGRLDELEDQIRGRRRRQ